MTDKTFPTVRLHTYFASSCAQRLWIALSLKQITYESIPVNLGSEENNGTEFTQVNPNQTVPCLEITSKDGETLTICQSLAAMDYLEEDVAFKDCPRLLPLDPKERAKVRELTQIIAVDVQPITNKRIAQMAVKLGSTYEKWLLEVTQRGFKAYEQLLEKTAGRYSFGDSITHADIVLYAQIILSQRAQLDLTQYPRIEKIFQTLKENKSFSVDGDWRSQPDTPEKHRIGSKTVGK